MAEEKQNYGFGVPSQSPDLITIEMLWHDLKQSTPFMLLKPSNAAELKHFCKERAKTPPQQRERLIVSYHKHLIKVVLQKVAQPVNRFRSNYFFTQGQAGLDSFFPLNK